LKKFVIITLSLFIFAYTAKSQNLAIGLHTGFAGHIGNGIIIGIPVGFNAEWAYNAKHSIGGRAHFSIGPRAQDPHIYYASPEYKYYLIGETLNGLFTGTYIGLGGGGGSAYVSLGGLLGYSAQIGKKLNLEGQIQFGYGNFLEIKKSVFHALPTIGIRYSI
jgi:hypothetical protein